MTRANRAYRLIVRRGGWAPGWMDPERVDHVEVVEVDGGEVVLFWDVRPDQARRLVRALRTDLAGMDAEEFMATWRVRRSA